MTHVDRFAELLTLEPGWDSYGADPPAPDVVEAVERFTTLASSLGYPAAVVNPSVVGGVGLTWGKRGSRQAYVEFRNTGSVHVAFMGGGRPVVRRVEPDAGLVEEIRRWVA